MSSKRVDKFKVGDTAWLPGDWRGHDRDKFFPSQVLERTKTGYVMRPAGTAIGTLNQPEHVSTILANRDYGSPPRARGQRLAHGGQRPAERFTPTCAGTTPQPRSPHCPLAVHPHVRGDNGLSVHGSPAPSGSPPRARGQRMTRKRNHRPLRFTPTCAGTTAWTISPASRCAVHPHVRGDNQLGRFGLGEDYGSPPRARGQRNRRCFEQV